VTPDDGYWVLPKRAFVDEKMINAFRELVQRYIGK
jgi:hypothetical protein